MSDRVIKLNNRRKSGQSLVELAAGLIVLLPVTLALVDCAVVAVGAVLNDAVCRDAARAASSGPPGSLVVGANRQVSRAQHPYRRADKVVRKVYYFGFPLKVREIRVTESLKDVPPPAQGGSIDGESTVETLMDASPPFLISAMIGPRVTLRARHSLPITCVMRPDPGTRNR